MQLHEELGIESLDELKKACESGEVRKLDGLGEKTEENLLASLETLSKTTGRMGIKSASEQAEPMGNYLDGLGAVVEWTLAGSYRRRKETVGDLDVLVRAGDRAEATEEILEYEEIENVSRRGNERVSVRLSSGLQVDFRFFEEEAFGSAMLYFTGSKAHNITLRKRAVSKAGSSTSMGCTRARSVSPASRKRRSMLRAPSKHRCRNPRPRAGVLQG